MQEPNVEEMAKKIGLKLPKEKKKKEKDVKEAIAKTSDRPYRDYSKQGALEVRGSLVYVYGCVRKICN